MNQNGALAFEPLPLSFILCDGLCVIPRPAEQNVCLLVGFMQKHSAKLDLCIYIKTHMGSGRNVFFQKG